MDNNENVKHFVESFVKFDENVKAAQEYIKETYNIDSTYSDDDDTIYIWTENLNENLNLAAAREYIEQEIKILGYFDVDKTSYEIYDFNANFLGSEAEFEFSKSSKAII